MTISSCKKIVDPEKDDIYTITGRLYQDCSMQPVANQRMDLHQAYITTFSGLKGGFLAETTTDENGNFRFEYKDAGGMEIRMRTLFGNNFNERMLNIPKRKNISDIIIFKSMITTNFQVSINVINSYSSSDTLKFPNFSNNTILEIPGPLSSGVLYTAINYPVNHPGYSASSNFGIYGKHITWYFNQYQGTYFTHHFQINKICNDTVFVVIDIN